MLNGALLWELECEDRRAAQDAVFAAQIMLSSGNYKKGTTPQVLIDSMYKPLDELMKEATTEKVERPKLESREQVESMFKEIELKIEKYKKKEGEQSVL